MRAPPDPVATWSRAAAAGLTFRPVTDADLPFMCRLYASTRADELAPVPWSDEQKAAFLTMQFQAQHAHYAKHYTGAQRLLVLRDGDKIGRLYLDRWMRDHRIIDIAFLSDHCGRGYGGALIRDLLDEAAAAGKGVSIHVEKNNPAMRLYKRLGFTAIEDKGVYDLMRWDAGTAA